MRQASQTAHAQPCRGADARSGTPEAKSAASRPGDGEGGWRAGSDRKAALATRVAEPPRVTRQSDGAMTSIGVRRAGGYADAAAQNAFCANTVCIISRIYDQSPGHNDLGIEGIGGNGAPRTGPRSGNGRSSTTHARSGASGPDDRFAALRGQLGSPS